MQTNQYTSLSLSKYLSEKMTFESEMWWEVEDGEEYERHGKKRKRVSFYPKLTFTDLLQYLKLYGEREENQPYCKSGCGCSYTHCIVYHEGGCVWEYPENSFDIDNAHTELLSNYKADDLTISIHCEKFLLDVIK